MVPFEFLITSNSAIEPAIPLAEAGLREIPIEPVTIMASRTTPPPQPGFFERLWNGVKDLFGGNKPEPAQTMDKVTESVKPENITEQVKPESISEQVKPENNNEFVKPENWETKETKSTGKQHIDPNNPRNNVREMKGNKNSPHPSQQKDYIKYQKDGVLYDKNEEHRKLIFQEQNLIKQKCHFLNKNNIMYKEFKKRLLELSDINLQRKLWLNIDNDTGLISSYSELFNSLLGDFDYDYEVENLEDNNLKQNLLKLKIMLKEYKEPFSYKESYDDNMILNDPNWKNIVLFAKSLPLITIKTSE